MKISLLDYTSDPEYKIGFAAAECYDSKQDRASCIKRAASCVDKGHLTTLRFAYATFNISGISRICSHQLVRMAHAGILQRSQRYVEETDIQFLRPPSLSPELETEWQKLEDASRNLYSKALQSGMLKEDARFALLHSAETSINLCLNFQAWLDFLRHRIHPAAQWEVRAVALGIGAQLAEIAPNIFEAYKCD